MSVLGVCPGNFSPYHAYQVLSKYLLNQIHWLSLLCPSPDLSLYPRLNIKRSDTQSWMASRMPPPSFAEWNLTPPWTQNMTRAEARTKSQNISQHWSLRLDHCWPNSTGLSRVPSPDCATATSICVAAPQEAETHSLAIQLSKARPAVINSEH